MKTKIYIPVVFIFLTGIFSSCNNNNNKITEPIMVGFINPPLKGVNVAYSEYFFNAEKGDTLEYKSGSKVVFPPNSLVDKDGNLIKGEVKINYREFSDPIDFFLSGVPMEYDSAGSEYFFESSGMCEINAYQKDEPVFVNSQNKPQVNLSSNNSDILQNLYVLDTIQKKWLNKGKSIIKQIVESIKSDTFPIAKKFISKITLPKPPIKPVKANIERPVFSVDVPYADFIPELKIFKNTKFEVDESDKTYKPEDADIAWDKVQIDKSEKEGIYIVTFKTTNKKVSYRVRPVYEGQDYAEAIKIFEKKQKDYEIEKKLLLEKQKQEEAEQIKISAELEKRWKEDQKKMEEEWIEEQKKLEKEQKQINALTRTFALESFGIWNCDKPILKTGYPIIAQFYDKNNNQLKLKDIFVVYKNVNGLCRYYNNYIKLLPDVDNMIWAVSDNKLIYLTYNDFKKCNISPETEKYSFNMNVYPSEIKSGDDIREFMDL